MANAQVNLADLTAHKVLLEQRIEGYRTSLATVSGPQQVIAAAANERVRDGAGAGPLGTGRDLTSPAAIPLRTAIAIALVIERLAAAPPIPQLASPVKLSSFVVSSTFAAV